MGHGTLRFQTHRELSIAGLEWRIPSRSCSVEATKLRYHETQPGDHSDPHDTPDAVAASFQRSSASGPPVHHNKHYR